MNDSPGSRPRSPDPVPGLRVVALSAAILGVLVLLAAAFVLSYPGIHQLARTAGMSVTLARIFPVIFDALLVVAIAAVLSLHGAGWWRRGYSWLITLLLLAAMAAGGVLHEVHPHIPHRPAAITAAVLPWALLLIAFSLLLSMLRQFRQARLSPAADLPATPAPASPAPAGSAQAGTRIGLDALLAGGTARIVPAQPSTAPAPAPAAMPAPPARPRPVLSPLPARCRRRPRGSVSPPTSPRPARPTPRPRPQPQPTPSQLTQARPTRLRPAQPQRTAPRPPGPAGPRPGPGPPERGGQQRGRRAPGCGQRLRRLRDQARRR